MKIIHTSDIHIDSPMAARLSRTEAAQRRREVFSTFRRIIDTAENNGYKAVIIAGDLFDNERVGARTLDGVIGAVEAASDVTFFYLPGNHEKQRLVSSGLKLPENLKIFGEDWTYFKLGEATLAGRTSFKENMFSELTLNPDEINILVLHGELARHTDSVSKIGTADIERLPIDYLALGHYHTYGKTKIGTRTVAAYSGTPEGRGFDESGVKGYLVLDISEYGIQTVFTRSAQRLLHTVEVDITSLMREIEIEEAIAAALADIDGCDLVRVTLTGEHSPELRRNTDALTERFSSSYYYFEVLDSSRLKISSEDYKNDKSLKGEFIRLVMGKAELSDEDKADIIECGIRALAGEVE